MQQSKSFALCLLLELPLLADAGPARITIVSIVGEDFYINGLPTYAGRTWNGHLARIERRLDQVTFYEKAHQTVFRRKTNG